MCTAYHQWLKLNKEPREYKLSASPLSNFSCLRWQSLSLLLSRELSSPCWPLSVFFLQTVTLSELPFSVLCTLCTVNNHSFWTCAQIRFTNIVVPAECGHCSQQDCFRTVKRKNSSDGMERSQWVIVFLSWLDHLTKEFSNFQITPKNH